MLRWLLQRPRIALISALVLQTIILVTSQGDFAASDPLWYADLAHRMAIDFAEPFANATNHPFEMRIGLTVPLSLIYRMFGVSTFTSNVPCLLSALGLTLIVYAVANTARAKLLGLMFVLPCTLLVRQASMLNVDLPCAVLMASSVLFLSWRQRANGPLWVVLAMVTWFAAFLVKETGLWCAPIWIYAVVHDLRDHGLRASVRRFVLGLAAGAALAIGYLALCAVVWNDPFARFSGIEELTDGHAWSMTARPAAVWIERLVWGPAVMFAKLFHATLIPAVLAPWLVRKEHRLWLVATGAFMALFWFGSTSFSTYAPLPLSPRMMLPVLPGILVLATLATDQAIERLCESRWRTPALIGLLVAVVVPGAVFIGAWATRPKPEMAAYAIVREAIEDRSRPVVLVCGDPRCAPISNFHFGFEPPPNLTIIYGGAFAEAERPVGAKVFAMVNLRRGTASEWVDPAADPRGYRVEKIVALELPILSRGRHVRLFDGGNGGRLWDALRAAN